MPNHLAKCLCAVRRCLNVVVRATLSVMASLNRAAILPYVLRGAPMYHMGLRRQIDSTSLVVKEPFSRSVNMLAFSNIISSSKFVESFGIFSVACMGVSKISSSLSNSESWSLSFSLSGSSKDRMRSICSWVKTEATLESILSKES
jgi:hypothetical protein